MIRSVVLALVLVSPLALASEATREQIVVGELAIGTGFLTTNDAMVFLFGENDAQGIDGAHIVLDQTALGGESIALSWTSPELAQLAIRFHTNGWEPHGSCAQGFEAASDGDLRCVAPPGTDAVSIVFLAGAEASYTLRYAYPAP